MAILLQLKDCPSNLLGEGGGGGLGGGDGDEQGLIKMAYNLRSVSPDKVSGCTYQNILFLCFCVFAYHTAF